eukprot:1144583-Pelagomonas_calceolata.AAC.4
MAASPSLISPFLRGVRKGLHAPRTVVSPSPNSDIVPASKALTPSCTAAASASGIAAAAGTVATALEGASEDALPGGRTLEGRGKNGGQLEATGGGGAELSGGESEGDMCRDGEKASKASRSGEARMEESQGKKASRASRGGGKGGAGCSRSGRGVLSARAFQCFQKGVAELLEYLQGLPVLPEGRGRVAGGLPVLPEGRGQAAGQLAGAWQLGAVLFGEPAWGRRNGVPVCRFRRQGCKSVVPVRGVQVPRPVYSGGSRVRALVAVGVGPSLIQRLWREPLA